MLALLYEPDRAARRAASRALTEGLRQASRPLAFIFNTLVQDKAVDDRLRRYPDPMAARHLANEIEPAGVASLLDACVARYALVARYYRLKARLLGLERLEEYDRYGGKPFGCMIGLYEFSSSNEDIEWLKTMSKVSAASHAPFIACELPSVK